MAPFNGPADDRQIQMQIWVPTHRLLRCSLSKVILQDVPLAQIVVEWDGEAAGTLNAMNLHHDHSAEGVVLHKLCTKFLEQTIVLAE